MSSRHFFHIIGAAFLVIAFVLAPTMSQAQGVDIYIPEEEEYAPRVPAPEERKSMVDTAEETRLTTVYYDKCMSIRDESVSINTQQDTCMCMAGNVRENLSYEEMLYVAGEPSEYTVSRERQFVEIYASCMRYPAWEQAYYQCYNHSGYRVAFRNVETFKYFCDCIADDVSGYYGEFGVDQMKAMVKMFPTADDPFKLMFGHRHYTKEFESAREVCMYEVTTAGKKKKKQNVPTPLMMPPSWVNKKR